MHVTFRLVLAQVLVVDEVCGGGLGGDGGGELNDGVEDSWP